MHSLAGTTADSQHVDTVPLEVTTLRLTILRLIMFGLQELLMLLQLHGVPIRPTSQRSSQAAEPRNVVGRGLRWPAAQRRLQVPQSPQADVLSWREAPPEQEPLQAPGDQPRSSVAEEKPSAVAERAQPCATTSQLSTATDIDMRDVEAAPGPGASMSCRPPVDVRSMVAATTTLLTEVCPDRGPSELHASAARYVQLLVESTSGERSARPAPAAPAVAADRSNRSWSTWERADGPQQHHVHFGSQVHLGFSGVWCRAI